MTYKKVTSLSLPKDQVYKIVQVMDQEVGLRWSLNDEGGFDLYAEENEWVS
jgi:hypothetical protein